MFFVAVQGILHMGKGLLSLHPFHGHRTLLSPVAMSGILTVLVACLDFPVCGVVRSLEGQNLQHGEDNDGSSTTVVAASPSSLASTCVLGAADGGELCGLRYLYCHFLLSVMGHAQTTLLDKHHYLLFCLSTAMFPRCLVTLDEALQPLNVTVRVGQAVMHPKRHTA
jgi:hypothetical protein